MLMRRVAVVGRSQTLQLRSVYVHPVLTGSLHPSTCRYHYENRRRPRGGMENWRSRIWRGSRKRRMSRWSCSGCGTKRREDTTRGRRTPFAWLLRQSRYRLSIHLSNSNPNPNPNAFRAHLSIVRLRFRDCKVSARHVVLREFDNDGFVMVTDKRSKKVDNLESVPYAAMCFLWFYVNEQKQEITRQVRIEGAMKRLERERFQHLYDREPLYCKIRSHLCDQGRQVDWNELKRRHDEILESVLKKENDLPMPDHFVGYKLYPTMMEFYFARDHLISDRLHYRKDTSADSWQSRRIAA